MPYTTSTIWSLPIYKYREEGTLEILSWRVAVMSVRQTPKKQCLTRVKRPFLVSSLQQSVARTLARQCQHISLFDWYTCTRNLNLMPGYQPSCLYVLSIQCYTTSQHMTTTPRVFSCIRILRYRRQWRAGNTLTDRQLKVIGISF